MFRADVSEAKAKLERLEEKLAEIESQKEEATTAINQARHVVYIQKESTSAEVFRLKGMLPLFPAVNCYRHIHPAELEALEEMHLWHTLKLSPDLVEFVYGNKYHVSIPCQKYTPSCPHVRVTKSTQTKLKERDSFPHFTSLIVKTAQALITETREKLDLKQVRSSPPTSTRATLTQWEQIVERLSDFWSSCAQLRSQFTFLGIKYPLQVEGVTDEHGHDYLRATATVMLPRVKGKTYISFILDKDTFTRWPLSVRGLKVDAKVAYGDVQYVLRSIRTVGMRSSLVLATGMRSSCKGFLRTYLVLRLPGHLVVSWMLVSMLRANLFPILIRIYTSCTLYSIARRNPARRGGVMLSSPRWS